MLAGNRRKKEKTTEEIEWLLGPCSRGSGRQGGAKGYNRGRKRSNGEGGDETYGIMVGARKGSSLTRGKGGGQEEGRKRLKKLRN